MAESFADITSRDVSDTQKQTIGKLIVVNAGETDPARKIHYTSSLIGHIRAALVYISRNAYDTSFDEAVHHMVFNILKTEWDLNGLQFALRRMERLFEDKPRTIYDVTLTNDLALVLQCRNNWRKANRTYFENNDAWMTSNEILADVQDTLIEIAIRWNLIIIPKEMSFNINQMPNLTHAVEYGGHSPLDE